MKLAEIGEFDLIAALASRVSDHDPRVVLGIGDDAAALRADSSRLLLATSDVMVEGVHFSRQTTSAEQLGWKSLAVNISDIAAMGGLPTFALVDVGFPADLDADYPGRIYDGMQSCASEYGLSLVGGDTVSSPTCAFIAITVLGEVEPGMIVSRSGAKPGDRIMVTGTLGDAAAGLALLAEVDCKVSPEARCYLEQAHLMPRPRLQEARAIVSRNWATAMIDISDGLAGDLTRLGNASGVGMMIDASSLPYSEAYKEFADGCSTDPAALALHGGEDYQLALTVPAGLAELVLRESASLGMDLTDVGQVRAEPGIVLRRADGTEEAVDRGGYEHFTGSESI